jgi:hypothetical protein
MAIGPGKYDAACTAARISCGARGAILIVLEGDQGNGFSCQFEASIVGAIDVPRLLEDAARQIREDLRRKASGKRSDEGN